MICQMTKSKNQIKYLLNSCELLWWQDKNHQDSYSSLIVSISYSSLTVPSPADKHQFGQNSTFSLERRVKREDDLIFNGFKWNYTSLCNILQIGKRIEQMQTNLDQAVPPIVFEFILFLAQHFDATLTCGSERAFRKRALSFLELAGGGGGQQWPEKFLSEASICHFLTQYLSTFCLLICSPSSGAADVTR